MFRIWWAISNECSRPRPLAPRARAGAPLLAGGAARYNDGPRARTTTVCGEFPSIAKPAINVAGCAADEVDEIRSLGRTLTSWRTEILAHHDTGASNGPTEGLNLCVKRVKRAGHGFRRFDHYRLRVLLHAGGITWPDRPRPPRLRTRSPHSTA